MSEPSSGRRRLFTLAGIGALVAGLGGFAFSHFSKTVSVAVENKMPTPSGKKTKILVLCGSGRKKGNSDVLAEAFASGAKEAGHTVDVFNVARPAMSACMHCEGCWSDGTPCVIKDQAQVMYEHLEQAELLVFVSPLYWYNLTGHLKCAMDRFYPYGKKNRLRKLAITEAMLLMCGQSHLLRSFVGPYEAYRQSLGYLHWKDRGRLFVTGVDEFGAMEKSSGLALAREMGAHV